MNNKNNNTSNAGLFNTEAEYIAAGSVACEYLLSRDDSFFFQPDMLPDHGDLDALGAQEFGIRWNDECYNKIKLIVSRMRDTIKKQIEVVNGFHSILPPDCAKCGEIDTWEVTVYNLDPTYKCNKCGFVIDPVAFTIGDDE